MLKHKKFWYLLYIKLVLHSQIITILYIHRETFSLLQTKNQYILFCSFAGKPSLNNVNLQLAKCCETAAGTACIKSSIDFKYQHPQGHSNLVFIFTPLRYITGSKQTISIHVYPLKLQVVLSFIMFDTILLYALIGSRTPRFVLRFTSFPNSCVFFLFQFEEQELAAVEFIRGPSGPFKGFRCVGTSFKAHIHRSRQRPGGHSHLFSQVI